MTPFGGDSRCCYRRRVCYITSLALHALNSTEDHGPSGRTSGRLYGKHCSFARSTCSHKNSVDRRVLHSQARFLLLVEYSFVSLRTVSRAYVWFAHSEGLPKAECRGFRCFGLARAAFTQRRSHTSTTHSRSPCFGWLGRVHTATRLAWSRLIPPSRSA